MTKEKLDESVERQRHARGVYLIKYFDEAKTTTDINGVAAKPSQSNFFLGQFCPMGVL